MEFSLNTLEKLEKTYLISKLENAKNELFEAEKIFNITLQEAWKTFTKAQENFNYIADEAQVFIDNVSSRLCDEYNQKSEQWKESSEGYDTSDWIDLWGVTLQTSFVLAPNPIDVDEDDIGEVELVLKQLPDKRD